MDKNDVSRDLPVLTAGSDGLIVIFYSLKCYHLNVNNIKNIQAGGLPHQLVDSAVADVEIPGAGVVQDDGGSGLFRYQLVGGC